MLKCFGPAAGAAAVVLAEKLSVEEGEFPKAILETLAAMGPAAQGALGALDRFRQQTVGDEPLPDLTDSRPDQSSDPVGWAMWAVQGRTRVTG